MKPSSSSSKRAAQNPASSSTAGSSSSTAPPATSHFPSIASSRSSPSGGLGGGGGVGPGSRGPRGGGRPSHLPTSVGFDEYRAGYGTRFAASPPPTPPTPPPQRRAPPVLSSSAASSFLPGPSRSLEKLLAMEGAAVSPTSVLGPAAVPGPGPASSSSLLPSPTAPRTPPSASAAGPSRRRHLDPIPAAPPESAASPASSSQGAVNEQLAAWSAAVSALPTNAPSGAPCPRALSSSSSSSSSASPAPSPRPTPLPPAALPQGGMWPRPLLAAAEAPPLPLPPAPRPFRPAEYLNRRFTVVASRSQLEPGHWTPWGGRASERVDLQITSDERPGQAERPPSRGSGRCCPVCLERHVDCTIRPCGHLLCSWCKQALRPGKCPLCRSPIKGSIPFLSSLCIEAASFNVHRIVNGHKEGVRQLPGRLRLQLLASIQNRRMLYGATLSLLLEGARPAELDLSHAVNADDADFVRIGQMPGVMSALTSLNLTGCQKLDTAGLASMVAGTERGLATVVLRGVGVVGGPELEAAAVAKLHSLRRLDLSDCTALKGPSLLAMCCASSSLQTLSLAHCHNLDSDILASICRNTGAALRDLDIFGCARIRSAGLASVAQHCRGLTRLNCGGCSGIPGDLLAEQISRLPSLKSLDVSFISQMGDENVGMVLQGCRLIETLSLKACDITDDLLHEIVHSVPQEFQGPYHDWAGPHANPALGLCPHMKQLDISFCTRVSEDAIMELARRHKKLIRMQVANCGTMSSRSKIILMGLLESKAKIAELHTMG